MSDDVKAYLSWEAGEVIEKNAVIRDLEAKLEAVTGPCVEGAPCLLTRICEPCNGLLRQREIEDKARRVKLEAAERERDRLRKALREGLEQIPVICCQQTGAHHKYGSAHYPENRCLSHERLIKVFRAALGEGEPVSMEAE